MGIKDQNQSSDTNSLMIPISRIREVITQK